MMKQLIDFLWSLQREPEKDRKKIHITELFLPLRAFLILRKYAFKKGVEFNKLLRPAVGIVWHEALSNFFKNDPNFISEKEFSVERNGFILVGRPDLYNTKNKTLYDFKLSFAKSPLSDVPDSWVLQLNLYRMLFYPEAKKLFIIWFNSNNIDILPVPVLAQGEIELFLDHKLNEIRKWLSSSKLPVCSREENWNGGRCAFCFAETICKKKSMNHKKI